MIRPIEDIIAITIVGLVALGIVLACEPAHAGYTCNSYDECINKTSEFSVQKAIAYKLDEISKKMGDKCEA